MRKVISGLCGSALNKRKDVIEVVYKRAKRVFFAFLLRKIISICYENGNRV